MALAISSITWGGTEESYSAAKQRVAILSSGSRGAVSKVEMAAHACAQPFTSSANSLCLIGSSSPRFRNSGVNQRCKVESTIAAIPSRRAPDPLSRRSERVDSLKVLEQTEATRAVQSEG